MNKNMRKISVITLALVALVFSGCAKYLDTEPTSSTATMTILGTTDAAKLAINGLNRIMICQYNDFGQGYNGEGTIRLYHGDHMGQDLMVVNRTGFQNTQNGDYYASNTSAWGRFAWYYYYMLIGNANDIINNIDQAEGLQADRDYIKAQALCYRAYAYSNLVQLYGRRWSDKNGESPACVLRLVTMGDDNLDRSTSKQVYAQIYKDLDDAIALFTASGKANSRTATHVMDLDVAYAIYARTALTREDWNTALTYAKKFTDANYPLMTVAEYKSGFCNPNEEWIWSLYNVDDETLYYYSYLAYIGYNSNAGNVRTTPKAISKHIFDQMDPTDIRRGLFLDPTGYEGKYNTNTNLASSQKSSNALYAYGFAYSKQDGRVGLYSTAYVAAYMQFKFRCNTAPGVGHQNLFRRSEMLLIEAEANYRLNKPDDAQAALVKLNATSGRFPTYTCTKTGTDLLNEIKLYRSIELWGEGFNWFDLKRWGDTLSRKAYADGGNWMTSFAVTIQPNEKNNWTWTIPKTETDYNKGILSIANVD